MTWKKFHHSAETRPARFTRSNQVEAVGWGVLIASSRLTVNDAIVSTEERVGDSVTLLLVVDDDLIVYIK